MTEYASLPKKQLLEKPGTIMKRLCRVLFFVFLCFFAMEAACRVYVHFRPFPSSGIWMFPFFPEFDRKDGRGLYYAHPYSSYDFKPNITPEINAQGFRSREFYGSKKPGSVRIVCVGGSTTYGVRNPYEESYPFLLEQALRKRLPEQDIEVINAGLISATSAETLHRILFKVIPLEPDIVIVYHGFNDLVPRIADDFKNDYSHFRKIPLNSGYGFFKYLNHSYLFLMLKRIVAGPEDLHSYIFNYHNIPASETQKLLNFEKNGPEHFSYNMDLIITILRAHDILPIVPTFAFMPGRLDGWCPVLPDSLWEKGVSQNNRVIESLVKKHQLPEVDYYAYAKRHPGTFSGKIHMKNRGNRLKAEFLADHLLSNAETRNRLVKKSSALQNNPALHK